MDQCWWNIVIDLIGGTHAWLKRLTNTYGTSEIKLFNEEGLYHIKLMDWFLYDRDLRYEKVSKSSNRGTWKLDGPGRTSGCAQLFGIKITKRIDNNQEQLI